MMRECDRAAGRRVGALAAAAGLTVRTLHYYEEIGLLVADRTDAGHRIYDDADVERLYRIRLLRRLGLPLDEISRALDDPAWNIRAAMATHLRDLDRRMESEAQLRRRLAQLTASMGDADGPLTRVRVFGLGPGQLTRDDQGKVVHGELQAGDGVVWLHPESPEFGLASPRTLGAATASVAVMVDDVDAHFEHARREGAVIDYEPVDQPYGYREYSARDSEGGLWSFMKALD